MNSALHRELLMLLRVKCILSLQLICRLDLILVTAPLDACADAAQNDAGNSADTS